MLRNAIGIDPGEPLYHGMRAKTQLIILRAIGSPPKIDISKALDRLDKKVLIFKGLIPKETFLPFFHEGHEEDVETFAKEFPLIRNEIKECEWGEGLKAGDSRSIVLTVNILVDFFRRVCDMRDEEAMMNTVLYCGPYFEHVVVRKLPRSHWTLTFTQMKGYLKEILKHGIESL